MRQSYPLISCICITDSRPKLLQRAINCLISQNYPNKELIISFPKSDTETKLIVNKIANEVEIKILGLEREKAESVGYARNVDIYKSRGDYVCVWDDDDWYHASRLSFQYNSMHIVGKAYNASVLRRLLLFDSGTGKAYMSFLYSWENTLMCRKEIIFQNQYANQNKGEDTHIVKFLDSKKFLCHIDHAPFLYVYIYHGANTWGYQHYRHLVNQSSVLDEDITNLLHNLLNN